MSEFVPELRGNYERGNLNQNSFASYAEREPESCVSQSFLLKLSFLCEVRVLYGAYIVLNNESLVRADSKILFYTGQFQKLGPDPLGPKVRTGSSALCF